MPNGHDFKNFPELTNRQMEFYYFDSPHKQITEPIRAKVIKVTDGDTIRVEWDERDFDFPVRLLNLAAPELKEEGGLDSQRWLASQILGKRVDIVVGKQRVEKWGRLLAHVYHEGFSMNQESVNTGHGVLWEDRAINPFGSFE